MTNSYKSYSTNSRTGMTERPNHLEKMKIREKHAERRDRKEKLENIKRKEWLKERKFTNALGNTY